MADRRRIVQVLNNLLANAARHSPASSPIRVAAERDGVHVAVSVADEGEGVAPELLPHLFRKHVPAGDGDAGDGLRRMGLGLAICKGLVEAHGGRIRAESDGAGPGHPCSPSPSRWTRRSDRTLRPAPRTVPPVSPGKDAEPHAHPRGGRRPADAALCARRARGGGLRAGGDGRSGRAARLLKAEKPAPGAARPGAARTPTASS